MLTYEALLRALQDREDSLAALVDRMDRLEQDTAEVTRRLAGTIQVVVDPVAEMVVEIPYELL